MSGCGDGSAGKSSASGTSFMTAMEGKNCLTRVGICALAVQVYIHTNSDNEQNLRRERTHGRSEEELEESEVWRTLKEDTTLRIN